MKITKIILLSFVFCISSIAYAQQNTQDKAIQYAYDATQRIYSIKAPNDNNHLKQLHIQFENKAWRKFIKYWRHMVKRNRRTTVTAMHISPPRLLQTSKKKGKTFWEVRNMLELTITDGQIHQTTRRYVAIDTTIKKNKDNRFVIEQYIISPGLPKPKYSDEY